MPDSSSSRISCDILLWCALILILLSGILAVVGCMLEKPAPQAAAVLGIIAIVLLAVGLLLLGIWWLICKSFTLCSVIIAAMYFMGILLSVFLVVGIVLALISWLGVKPEVLKCALVSATQSAIWGWLNWMLYRFALNQGCVTENPNGSKPPASSSSSLSSPDGITKEKSEHPLPYSIGGQVGLGDMIKMVTGAMGIEPCQKCHERAVRLNRLASFGNRKTDNSDT